MFSAAPFIGLLPFIILAFFAFPSMDDHYLHFSTNKLGWWGSLQSFFLYQDSGRFGSFPFLLFFAKQDWILQHYWFMSLFFLSLTFLSFYLLLSSINRYFLAEPYHVKSIVWAAAALLLLYLNIIPEPASAYYWMTGTFQNQLAIIYTSLLLSLLIISNHEATSYLREGLVILLLILLCGSIEPAAFIVQLAFIFYYGQAYAFRKKISKKIIIYHIISIIAMAVLLLMPGTRNRISYIAKDLPLAVSVGLSLYELGKSLFLFCGNTNSWLLIAFVLMIAPNSKIKRPLLNQVSIILALFLVWLLFFSLSFGINGKMADRTHNMILFFMICVLIWFLFTYISNKSFIDINSTAIKLIFIIVLLTGENFIHAVNDIPSACLYSQVMKKRIQMIDEAKKGGKNSVTLNDYDTDRKMIIGNSSSLQKKLLNHTAIYPATIFYHDDLTDNWAKSFGEFHQIDTIKTSSGIYPRWGLDHSY